MQKHLPFQPRHNIVKQSDGKFLVVLVYVDDIMIASTDDDATTKLTAQLSSNFKLRDLGTPKFFLGLEIPRSNIGISINQRKYVLYLLDSSGFSSCKRSAILMEPNHKLYKKDGIPLDDVKQYTRLVDKLQYRTITRTDICIFLNLLSILLLQEIHTSKGCS